MSDEDWDNPSDSGETKNFTEPPRNSPKYAGSFVNQTRQESTQRDWNRNTQPQGNKTFDWSRFGGASVKEAPKINDYENERSYENGRSFNNFERKAPPKKWGNEREEGIIDEEVWDEEPAPISTKINHVDEKITNSNDYEETQNSNNAQVFNDRDLSGFEDKMGKLKIQGEKPRPPMYTPEGPSDKFEDMFLKNISEGIDFHKYKDIKVHVSGGDERQHSIEGFDAKSGIHPKILTNIQYYRYNNPTPIQRFVIPLILQNTHDIMACAQTGSGKTAAFLIPTFSSILFENLELNESSIVAPHVLIIAPTRELINQIFVEMRKFAYDTGIRAGVIYGGVTMSYIMRFLSNGCDVLSATPGRLLSMIRQGIVSLKNVRHLILDEADRMLDMGFIDDVRKIIYDYDMPDQTIRRCYMFSATFPEQIQSLASEILTPNYYFIAVGIVGGAADSIQQIVHNVAPHEKRDRLMEILSASPDTKALIFVGTKRGADFLTTFLCQKNFRATSIHGDRFQEQREEALNSFTRGRTPILVATSVAARGLDIPDVDIVINYDLPNSIDEYVHRIGRTGRLGNLGSSISFFTQGIDDALAESLVTVLKNAGQEIPQFLSHYDYTQPSQSGFIPSRDTRNISTRHFRENCSSYAPQSNQQPSSVSNQGQDEEWD